LVGFGQEAEQQQEILPIFTDIKLVSIMQIEPTVLTGLLDTFFITPTICTVTLKANAITASVQGCEHTFELVAQTAAIRS
jgi:hypothetical protein